ncbi:MAG: tetratricopeptide repeat protein, partial [Polyangia bacterium]
DLLADWLPAADVLAADGKQFYGEGGVRYYSTAWGIVYLLYTRHAEAFARYRAALAGGARGEAAWRGAFGAFGPRELDAEMHEWFSVDRPWAHAVPMALPLRDARSVRTLAPVDVHLLWAALRPWDNAKHLDAVAAELATAERLAPSSPSVQARLAELEVARDLPDRARTRLERALADHPDDERLLLLRAQLLVQEQLERPAQSRDFGAVAELTARLVRDDASAPSLRFAANVLVMFGDKRRSVALAERSTTLAPDCATCFEVLSVTREAAGDLTGAVAAAETAQRLIPEGLDDSQIAARVARLKSLTKR